MDFIISLLVNLFLLVVNCAECTSSNRLLVHLHLNPLRENEYQLNFIYYQRTKLYFIYKITLKGRNNL